MPTSVCLRDSSKADFLRAETEKARRSRIRRAFLLCGGRSLRPLRRPGGNRDLHDLAAPPRESGEHRIDKARHEHVEAVRLRARLGTSVEQRSIRSSRPDMEVDLAVIFDVAVDVVTIPERVVPAPEIAAAPAPAEARTEEWRAPIGSPGHGRIRIRDIAHLPAIDSVAELHDHVGAALIRRWPVAARFQLLGDDSGVTLE